MMRLFRFRGGIRPRSHKRRTADSPTRFIPLPTHLYLPLLQHMGAAAVPQVRVGDRVLKGQLLAAGQGSLSAPIHAPTSGTVVAIKSLIVPHASGLPASTLVLETDGEDRWINPPAVPSDPFALPPEEVANRVETAGIVGMGGACFPAAVKLRTGYGKKVHTLLLNGAECEPYLTCDDRLMREVPEEIIDGARLMRHAVGAERILIAVEDNKPIALAALSIVARDYPEIELITLPSRYPMGSEKQLIRTVLGLEVPAQGLTTDIGVVVHNVATARAVHQALRQGRPLLSRVVTVTGSAVPEPQNLEVLLGTLVSELLMFCDTDPQAPARLLMGGPMMGQPLANARVPVVKGFNGVVALTADETVAAGEAPCIRCGRCVEACPMGLTPLALTQRIRHDDFQGALDLGALDCIACGSCAYACPSRIPVVQYLAFAKGELASRHRGERKAAHVQQLMAQQQARLAREAQAKAEAAARRKAERAAKQKARKQARRTEEATS